MLAIMTTQYYTASSIDGLIADSENSLSWHFQFSEPSGVEDEYPRFIAEVWRDGDGLHDVRVDRQHTGFLSEPSKWRGVPDVLADQEGQAYPGRPIQQHAHHDADLPPQSVTTSLEESLTAVLQAGRHLLPLASFHNRGDG